MARPRNRCLLPGRRSCPLFFRASAPSPMTWLDGSGHFGSLPPRRPRCACSRRRPPAVRSARRSPTGTLSASARGTHVLAGRRRPDDQGPAPVRLLRDAVTADGHRIGSSLPRFVAGGAGQYGRGQAGPVPWPPRRRPGPARPVRAAGVRRRRPGLVRDAPTSGGPARSRSTDGRRSPAFFRVCTPECGPGGGGRLVRWLFRRCRRARSTCAA